MGELYKDFASKNELKRLYTAAAKNHSQNPEMTTTMQKNTASSVIEKLYLCNDS